MWLLALVSAALGSGMDFDTAVAKLSSASTWCDGATALAATKDPRALGPLMRAYESREETSKGCLLDAMEALGGASAADAWFDGARGDDRRLAVHLMELFAADSHLERLAAASDTDDDRLRFQVVRSLRTQLQTDAWERTMIALLTSPRADVRRQAVDSLSRRRTSTAAEALKARLAVETDPKVRAALELAVGA